MAFPPGFLDQLRSRVSLAELIGKRVRLVRKGREYGGLCPFHNEKTPSFYVVEDKGFFHCFGCGAHGDAIGFVMRADNLDFIEAVERLAGEAGIAVPQQTPQERERAQRQKTQLEALAAAADFYEEQLWSPSGPRAREYLDAARSRRGDDPALPPGLGAGRPRRHCAARWPPIFPKPCCTRPGCCACPRTAATPYDYFRGRVIFPIGDRAGRTIAFGGRIARGRPAEIPEFARYAALRERPRALCLGRGAGQSRARREGAPSAIVVEGYMDVIALHRAGFGTAVAPLGTALTEMQLHELWRLSPEPVLCFDGDTAGQRAARRALDRALPLLQPGRSLRFATLPPGEDPDSLIAGGGSAAMARGAGERASVVRDAVAGRACGPADRHA